MKLITGVWTHYTRVLKSSNPRSTFVNLICLLFFVQRPDGTSTSTTRTWRFILPEISSRCGFVLEKLGVCKKKKYWSFLKKVVGGLPGNNRNNQKIQVIGRSWKVQVYTSRTDSGKGKKQRQNPRLKPSKPNQPRPQKERKAARGQGMSNSNKRTDNQKTFKSNNNYH